MLDQLMKIADRASATLSRRKFFTHITKVALPAVGFLGAWLGRGQSASAAQTVWACKYVCGDNSKTSWFCSPNGFCPANPHQGGCRNWIFIGSAAASCTCKQGAEVKKCCKQCVKAVKKGRGEPDTNEDPKVLS